MLKKVIGVLLILGALYVGWTSITPYVQNYPFWSMFGPIGLMSLTMWWVVLYGWLFIVAIILLVVGVILVRRSG